MRSEPLLEVRDLSVNIGDRRLLHKVNLQLAPGETLGLIGESGSGKTLTALAVLGMLPAQARLLAGSIRFAGQELAGPEGAGWRQIRGRGIAMLFQDPRASLNPVRTVGSQLAELLRHHYGLPPGRARAEALAWLERVGLPDPPRLARSWPFQLSGGMAQRAALALSLSCQPRLLLADEPTSALDVTVQAQIMALLAELRAELDMALLFITHDLALAAGVADHVAVMRAGQVVEHGQVATLLEHPNHAFTRQLLEEGRRWRAT